MNLYANKGWQISFPFNLRVCIRIYVTAHNSPASTSTAESIVMKKVISSLPRTGYKEEDDNKDDKDDLQTVQIKEDVVELLVE